MLVSLPTSGVCAVFDSWQERVVLRRAADATPSARGLERAPLDPRARRVAAAPAAGTFGGSLDLTSDYFVRGISRSNDEPALQLDLH